MIDRCAERGIGAGYALGRDYPELEDGLLVALTERRSREEIDRYAEVLAEVMAAVRPGVTA
jgi:glycine dehydrogenase subunit 1